MELCILLQGGVCVCEKYFNHTAGQGPTAKAVSSLPSYCSLTTRIVIECRIHVSIRDAMTTTIYPLGKGLYKTLGT